jgi:hypothetical protein
MDAANTATEQVKADQIAVTWAMTDSDPAKRQRIGKIWAEGKWPVTDGVKLQAYVFELVHYPDFEAFSVDLEARMRAGVSAIVAGRLKRLPELDPLQTHPRVKDNFADDPSWLFQLDFDGLAATDARRIDRPEDFGAVALREARQRLPAAFDADCVLYATSSSGLPFNAKGEPANGRARFRLVFLLSRPLTFAQQRQIVVTLALKWRGLSCLDTSIYVLPQFSFIARPKFSAGMNDPIQKPVSLYEAAERRVNVDMLLGELGVDLAPESDGGTRRGSGRVERAEGRLLHVDPAIRYELVERLVAAIPNNLEREKWIGVAHALQGVFGDNYRGREIWLAFCERRLDGGIDPDEDERVWDTLYVEDGHAGVDTLIRLAQQAGTPEATAATEAVRQAQAEAAFDEITPEMLNEIEAEDGPERPLEPGRRDLLVTAWLDRDIPPRDYLLGHIICTTSRWLMFGETGVGKTLLTLDMAAAIASGSPMLGWAGQRATRVMYLDGELPAETFKERMQLIAGRYGRDISLYGYNRDDLGDGQMPPLNESKGEKWLMREIDEVKPELVVFDSIMALMDGVMGEEESWAPVKHLARKLTRRRLAQIWLHHTGHDKTKGFGTKTKEWEMDTVAKLNFADESHEAFTMEFTKARLRTPANAPEFKPRTISLGPDGWISEPLRGAPGRKSEDVVMVKRAIIETYDRLAGEVAETADGEGKPVRKVETSTLRDEVKSRGWLDTKETGGLTDSARKIFQRAKSDLLAGSRYVESEGWFWAAGFFSTLPEEDAPC